MERKESRSGLRSWCIHPGCHMTHVPGYVKQVKDLKAKGADVVAFMAVNDPFVMSAWGRVVGAKEDLIFLSDPAATLSTQLGLSVDRSAQGLGIRGASVGIWELTSAAQAR
ncbi:hypothetical protein M422DRAFT_774017 [Sphaerobolus stellatus SS14]|nr:hypothetical protein M422DRAFT_774017 [Sphaerobolus stellatus SS14]